MPLYQAVYFSERIGQDAKVVDGILHQSRRNNKLIGVTGALIVSDSHFIQVVEGRRPALSALIARIMQDERHANCILALFDNIDQRIFERFSMASATLGHPSNSDLLDVYLPSGLRLQDMSGAEIWELVEMVIGRQMAYSA